MPKFQPSAAVLDIDDQPMKDGKINDVGARARINAIRVRLASASEKEQPAIQEELRLAIEDAQPIMTVGGAIIAVLTNPLPDLDDKSGQRQEAISGEEKTDLMMMAIAIKRTPDGATVQFNEKDTKTIKARVARGYPSPIVVGRIYEAITPDEKGA